MEHVLTWNYLIAIYLFTAGLSSGSAIIASIADILGNIDERIKRVAAYLAPFPVMLGLLCLVGDLHRPWNFYKVLIHYNPTSVMSWGAFFLLVFPIIAVIYAGMVYFNIEGPLRKITSWIQLVLGLAIGIYAGLLLAAIYNNPVWSNPLIVFLFFVSALSTGACMVVIGGNVWDALERVIRKIIPEEWLPEAKSLHFDHENLRLLIGMDAVIIIVELMVISTIIISYALRPTGDIALGAIFTGGYYILFWLGLVLLGLTIPLVLAILELQNKLDDTAIAIVTWLEPGLVLLGGFILRYVIVYGGQIVYPILTVYK